MAQAEVAEAANIEDLSFDVPPDVRVEVSHR